MKVLVINEPYVKGFNRSQRWAARTRGRVLRAPDWLAYATAVLEEAGIDVRLFDFPAEGWDKQELRRLVKAEAPDYVVLDSTTPSIYSDIECAGICKEEAQARVIMVGPHASALPEETLLSAKVLLMSSASASMTTPFGTSSRPTRTSKMCPESVTWKEAAPQRPHPGRSFPTWMPCRFPHGIIWIL